MYHSMVFFTGNCVFRGKRREGEHCIHPDRCCLVLLQAVSITPKVNPNILTLHSLFICSGLK